MVRLILILVLVIAVAVLVVFVTGYNRLRAADVRVDEALAGLMSNSRGVPR
jgi:LemA protein